MTIGSFFVGPNVLKYPAIPFRATGWVYGDDFNREALAPTGAYTLYTAAETGAGGSSSLSGTVDRMTMTTDANIGDDQSVRTSGLKIDRAYPLGSTFAGMAASYLDQVSTTVTIDLPFVVASATLNEGFVGIHSGVAALTDLPTTARHLGIYWDISAGANYMLTSSDGTTQTTTDTTVAVNTGARICRITWTAEDVASIQMLTGAGAVSATKAVTAFNGSSGAFHEIHWFIQTETTAARTLNAYPWRIAWT